MDAFSQEFDDELRGVAQRYRKYGYVNQNEKLMDTVNKDAMQNEWADRGCFAPV